MAEDDGVGYTPARSLHLGTMNSTVSIRRPRRPPRSFPRRSAEGYPIRWVRTSLVRELCDPFEGCWQDLSTPMTMAEVEDVLRTGTEVMHLPFEQDFSSSPLFRPPSRRHHAEKIAWFARYGFQEPLDIDVGVPSEGCHVRWFVQDGNHRLAAGIVRQVLLGEDPWLPLEVSGSLDYAKDLGLG